MIADLLKEDSKAPIQVIVSVDDLRSIMSDIIKQLELDSKTFCKPEMNKFIKSIAPENDDENILQDRYISRCDLLAMLRVDSTTIWRWQRAGKLHAYRINNRNVYKLSDVKTLLQQYGYNIE